MLKNDKWIKEQALAGMIQPYSESLVRNEIITTEVYSGLAAVTRRKVVSYGTSSYGYDLRLSPKDFRVFRHIPGTVINPKAFNPENLVKSELHEDEFGSYFILPAHSYGLGVALEYTAIPNNVTGILFNKSTMVRCGVILPTTIIEAGWCGHITIEFSNSSAADCRIYANEGIAQLLFFEGEECEVHYETRKGKYQNQQHEVTLPKV